MAKDIVEGERVEDIAKKYEISERVVFKWKKDPKFITAMEEHLRSRAVQRRGVKLGQMAKLQSAIVSKVSKGLAEGLKPINERNFVEWGDFQKTGPKLLAELRMFSDHEEDLFDRALGKPAGRGGSIGGGSTVIQGDVHVQQQNNTNLQSTKVLAFDEFLKNASLAAPEKEIEVEASNDKEALVLATRKAIIDNPEILHAFHQDEIAAESKQVRERGPKR